jgi:hypothetical protein
MPSHPYKLVQMNLMSKKAMSKYDALPQYMRDLLKQTPPGMENRLRMLRRRGTSIAELTKIVTALNEKLTDPDFNVTFHGKPVANA